MRHADKRPMVVDLLGFVSSQFDRIRRARCFVIGSEAEGIRSIARVNAGKLTILGAMAFWAQDQSRGLRMRKTVISLTPILSLWHDFAADADLPTTEKHA
jgi:hypothetical protein